jgi:hypothetical protein
MAPVIDQISPPYHRTVGRSDGREGNGEGWDREVVCKLRNVFTVHNEREADSPSALLGQTRALSCHTTPRVP